MSQWSKLWEISYSFWLNTWLHQSSIILWPRDYNHNFLFCPKRKLELSNYISRSMSIAQIDLQYQNVRSKSTHLSSGENEFRSRPDVFSKKAEFLLLFQTPSWCNEPVQWGGIHLHFIWTMQRRSCKFFYTGFVMLFTWRLFNVLTCQHAKIWKLRARLNRFGFDSTQNIFYLTNRHFWCIRKYTKKSLM